MAEPSRGSITTASDMVHVARRFRRLDSRRCRRRVVGALLCIGVASLFFFHVTLNVGMVLQLVPVTGITIPLFSLGGSNALAMLLGIGILMSVSRSRLRP